MYVSPKLAPPDLFPWGIKHTFAAAITTLSVEMILFDCERLKHPYQGFYTYCDSLGRALAAEARLRSEKMCFYLPERFEGRFGDDMDYLRYRSLDRYFLRTPSGIDIWHCARQRSHFMPNAGGAKVLLTVHDLNFFLRDTSIKHARHWVQMQCSLDHADRIVTISEFSRRQLLESNFILRDKKIDMVYNGIIEYTGTPVRPAVVPAGPYLLSVSRIAKLKNFEVLVPLLEGNDLSLVLVGAFDKYHYENRVMEAARKWGVQDRVIFTGPVSEDEKYWYMENCHAFVFPSLAEGFGLPVLEAMRCGRPVFVSDRMSIPEITGEYGFYFNHDFDPDGMKSEFEKGMSAFERGEIDVKAMIAHAESFSWKNAAKQYFAIYDDMLSDR